jgi:PPOX class probable F420-dependent enzyme
MDSAEARRRLALVPVARLATVDRDGHPHIVPIVFALDGETLYFAVDAKPKTTARLQRLKNIAANPHVAVLADHYEDDWTRIWWVRAEGVAHVVTDLSESARAIGLLTQRYAQYRRTPPPGPAVAISIRRWSGWSGA